MAAWAASNAAAAAVAWVAASSALVAVSAIHVRYGLVAADIEADAGPIHSSSTSWVIVVSYDVNAEEISAASPRQAEATVIIGVEPGPAYRRPELISGDSSA